MAEIKNNKVVFQVKTNAANKVYICGSVAQLGAWDASKAVELKKNEDGIFEGSKLLPAGMIVEYKVLSSKDWKSVEKTAYGEEVQNHLVSPQKGTVSYVEVERFN